MAKKFPLATLAGLLLVSASLTGAAELILKVADKEPPKDLDAAVRARLQTNAVQLLDGGKPVYEFWFCAEVPLPSKPASPAKALDAVKQTTLLGAVSVAATKRDYRDYELAAGVYTMRLGLQPQDGNHLGTSEYAWFALLIAAKHDPKPDGLSDYKSLVKASSKDTSTDHPLLLSLRPAATTEGEMPSLNEPASEHKSVRVRLPAKVAGQEDKTSLVFEVVYQGAAKK